MSGDVAPWEWPSGTVAANGIDLHYCRSGGDGPPFVIAHGITDDGLCRAPLARDLQGEYDVVLYDARGHGRSDAPAEGYGVGDRVADLVGLVEGLALESPVLFGHSLGGNTVAAAAARHPDLARAVVLEDPAGMLVTDRDDDGIEARVAEARENIERWRASTPEELLETEEELVAYREAGREDLAGLLANARVRVSPHVVAIYREGFADPAETFPRITAPTLVLKADADAAGRGRDRELASLLPDGTLVHVEGAGHCVFRDAYDAAYRDLREFLAS